MKYRTHEGILVLINGKDGAVFLEKECYAVTHDGLGVTAGLFAHTITGEDELEVMDNIILYVQQNWWLPFFKCNLDRFLRSVL